MKKRRRTGALVVRAILPDEAQDWALRMQRFAGLHGDCFRRLASFRRLAFTGEARGGAGLSGESSGRSQRRLGNKVPNRTVGAAGSRLEPVIRAREATGDVRGWFFLVQVPPAWWATPRARDQHPRLDAKAAGRAGWLDGAPADEREGMRQGRNQPKRVKRTATRTSRDSTPREWTWAEQAPSPNDDGGKP